MTSEQPFKIDVPDDTLALLKRKLDDTRLPDEVNAAGWAYGAPLADIKRLVSRWKDGGVPPRVPIPLLFVHGWPGSFLEVTKILPLLTAVSADHPSFHVVSPSLPGFAWSDGVLEKGFFAEHYAELFNKLMISLGYSEYVTQGGNWGHLLTLTAASKYGPEHVKASHSNMPICDPPSFLENPITLLKYLISSFTARERQFAAHTENFVKNGRGYLAEQSTKPQTLGFSLADSPVGPARVDIREARRVDRRVPVDRRRRCITLTTYISCPELISVVLTWVSIYWFSRAGPAASVRIYYEYAHADNTTKFPKTSSPGRSVLLPQRSYANSQSGNIVFESEHEVGGHFAAYEQPEALVADLRKMFGKSGPAAGVVPGYTGY
ncbi:Alpha/Beta hydrolase protein [Lactarius sanguifluus]|nr:Alpha/Beta hydrolase protein [Lactarius sanguifluus]